MTMQIGLPVVYVDQDGTQYPALVQSIVDGTHANLAVFITEASGFRNDQQSVAYAETPTPGCFSFISLA